jgi:tetratricopeptide (TPR) repeat protein
MVVLYLGLIIAYGAVALANDAVFTGTVHRVLLGIIVASGLLHFYYDGFIWKVRDRSIKAGLDVEGGALSGDGNGDGRPRWMRHAVAWSLFIVPTGMLAATQTYTPHASKLDDYVNIRAAVPDDNRNRLKLASALFTSDRLEEAAAEYELAIGLKPDDSIGYVGLGKVRSEQQRWGKAILAYREAARLDPDNAPTQLRLGLALLSSGALADAQTALEAALELDPESYDATANLGALYQAQGATDRARSFYAAAIKIDPNAAAAYYNLAVLNEAEGDLRAATEQYRNALRVEPNATAAREDLRRLESQL